MCVFCDIAKNDPKGQKILDDEYVFAVRDTYAVAEGHTLVVSKRHVADFFDLTPEEQCAMIHALKKVRDDLLEDENLQTDGFNIGWNVGSAAGQTIMHVHAHIIPRKWGDVNDPIGGVRNVIPERGNYHSKDFQPLIPALGGVKES